MEKSNASTRAAKSSRAATEAAEDPAILDGLRRRGRAPSPPPTLVSTNRVALKSLLASAWPWATFSSLKRTSCVEDIASRPKRTPSAPWASIKSTGSMPVPKDFDIRRPSGAWMTEWM